MYTGQQPNESYQVNNSACSVLKKIIDPISSFGQNIMILNWLISTYYSCRKSTQRLYLNYSENIKKK